MRSIPSRSTHAAGRPLLLVLLSFVTVFWPGSVTDTEGAEAPGPPAQFLILLKPAHADRAATEEEKAKITQHFDYLKGLLAEGKVLTAGMTTDDYLGIVILQAPDRLEAERILASDPAVGADIFLAELHPFRIAGMSKGK
jgi:uncharacterized protein YciI